MPAREGARTHENTPRAGHARDTEPPSLTGAWEYAPATGGPLKSSPGRAMCGQAYRNHEIYPKF